MIFKLLYIYILLKPFIVDVMSAEKANNDKKATENIIKPHNVPKQSYRRFNEDMNDNEWHLSHLRDTGFFRRNQCPGETVEDKIKKYKNTLKSDGALVQYVYAEPLPVDASDIKKSDTCATNKIHISKTKTQKQLIGTKNNDTKDNATVPEEVNSATTTKIKGFKANITVPKRRHGEYAFSSVEYYDEVPAFDEDSCPPIVQVINLDMDQLRNYDVECEMIIEWRSLDDN